MVSNQALASEAPIGGRGEGQGAKRIGFDLAASAFTADGRELGPPGPFPPMLWPEAQIFRGLLGPDLAPRQFRVLQPICGQ